MSAHGGRRNKGHGGDHENHERWLLTYADMITLLVAFFIMLYAMSVTNQAKFVKLALSVRSGFGNGSSKTSILIGPMGTSPHPKIESFSVQAQKDSSGSDTGKQSGRAGGSPAMASLKGAMDRLIASSKIGAHITLRDDERGIVISVHADKYTFDSGSYELKPALKPVLLEMASIIANVPNVVRVEGHTDNLPIHNALVASNWDLSSMRASKVLTYLLENNRGMAFAPDRFSSSGYADTRPLAQNDTDAHRAMNRRVDIVILNDEDGQPLLPVSSISPAAVSESPAPVEKRPGTDKSHAPTSVDITDTVRPATGTHGKIAAESGNAEHFTVEPFMPKINLKDKEVDK